MDKELNRILTCIDEISEKLSQSKLTEQIFKAVSKQSKEVGEYLGIESERLSTIWALLTTLTIQHTTVDFEDISNYLHISIVKVMSYNSDFEELVKFKVLRKDRSADRRRRRKVPERLNSMKYFVPSDIIFSLTKGETTLPNRTKQNLSHYEILDMVSNLIKNDLDNDLIDYRGLCEEIELLFEENKENPFLQLINGFHLPILEQIILFFVCSEFAENDPKVDLVRLLRTLYSDTENQLVVRKEFMENKTKLQELDLVDLQTGSFRSDSEISLTENGSSILFQDDKKFFIRQEKANHKDLILSTSIVEKELFFNEKERKNLEFLTGLLQPNRYREVMDRMVSMGLKPQITVLIHGSPGTGKTEFVYQIAKSTGRHIKRVEISETKNHFYGDSEKLTSKIFSDFSLLRKSLEVDPILFVNEIDGWLGRRSIGGSSSVDMTENSIQSIILQKMEEFEGILIGSTNVWKRLDASYQRRFGFKIELSLPDSVTREKIWQYKLPVLTDNQTKHLSETHELSGGMIDNVCRKVAMSEILTGNIPTMEEIHEFCEGEFLERSFEKRKIGYIV